MGHAVVKAVQGIVERQRGIAAQAENIVHAVTAQHAYEGFRAVHLVHDSQP